MRFRFPDQFSNFAAHPPATRGISVRSGRLPLPSAYYSVVWRRRVGIEPT